MKSNQDVVSIIESTALSKKAILFFLKNAVSEPSHDFDHAFKTASIAVESGVASKLNKEKLQDLFIVGIFHDIVRSSEAVDDAEGVKKSAELAISFCKQNNLSQERVGLIAQTILSPKSTKIGFHLDFADAVHFLLANRIQSFSIENSKLRDLFAQQVLQVYESKFGRKIQNMPRTIQFKLNAIASQVLGSGNKAIDLGKLALTNANTVKSVKQLYAFSKQERMHATFDLISSLVLQHHNQDKKFAQNLLSYLKSGSFWLKKYDYTPYTNPLLKQKLVSLNSMLSKLKNKPRLLEVNWLKKCANEHSLNIKRVKK